MKESDKNVDPSFSFKGLFAKRQTNIFNSFVKFCVVTQNGIVKG